jgi:ribosomal protein S18 acetylase RimI-like enzyme
MSAIADDEPLPVEALAEYQRAGRAWAAVDRADRPVAYLITDFVDGFAHIEQVSVHPDHGRQGLGRALIDHAAAQARTDGRRP